MIIHECSHQHENHADINSCPCHWSSKTIQLFQTVLRKLGKPLLRFRVALFFYITNGSEIRPILRCTKYTQLNLKLNVEKKCRAEKTLHEETGASI
jgi:hypothetical protein